MIELCRPGFAGTSAACRIHDADFHATVSAMPPRQKLFPIWLVSLDRIRAWSYFDADTGKDLAVELREDHIPDFSNWKNHDAFESAFADLLRDLRKPA